MTAFKFPPKGNQDSPLPSTQLQIFPFTYQYHGPEHWNWDQLSTKCCKEPTCFRSHSPALWSVTLSSYFHEQCYQAKWKTEFLPPPNPQILTFGVWGLFCLARNYEKVFFLWKQKDLGDHSKTEFKKIQKFRLKAFTQMLTGDLVYSVIHPRVKPLNTELRKLLFTAIKNIDDFRVTTTLKKKQSVQYMQPLPPLQTTLGLSEYSSCSTEQKLLMETI